MAPFALEGIHVLDFTWVAVGPITTKYLADNGADVVKIESSARIDVLRAAPPYADGKFGINRSQFFADYNTSKKGVTLNLSDPRARELVMRLVPWADVVVENFTPKVMRGWEMDYDHLRQVKPDIIMLSSCLQGQTGPQAMMPGFGQLMGALSGFYYISGYPGGDPAPPYGAYTDFITPRFAVAVLLAALDYRRRTGAGQYIDISQYEASLHFLAPALIDYFASGRVLEAQGNRSERYAPHGAYRCRDEAGAERWISIAVANDPQWQGLLDVLGNPACEERFATMLGRLQNAGALDDFLAAQVRDREVWDLTAGLQMGGVAAYPVQSCLDLHQDENLESFGFWNWLEHKEMGPAPYMGLEHHLSATPGQLRSAAPALGQHTDEVLQGMLGLDAAEIAQLRKDGVLM
ncbi:MAG TPA: CoA transferase [Candidatus Binataceae bacterium]|jgi:benzylsuccinate CoA-transferase BbsF subunit|nr:CoA transferase [Candidatus Binataceae bacterium]